MLCRRGPNKESPGRFAAPSREVPRLPQTSLEPQGVVEAKEIRAALDRHWAASDAGDSGDRVVRETQHFADPFDASPSRAEWVERMSQT